MRNWTVDNLDNGTFLPKNWGWGWRGFGDWVALERAQRLTEAEAMHIVRSFPAFNLCARQVG
jgi:hypothetical protein